MKDWVTEVISTGGPLLLVLMMFIENVFPPIPSEIVLPLAGYLVHEGQLNPVVAVLAATLGSVLGAIVLYEGGRYGGRPLILRWGKVLRVDAVRLNKADAWMDRHGPKVVLIGRMVPLARSVVSVPAGTTQMRRPLFLLYTTIGSLAWNCLLIGAGWALGATWERATDWVGTFTVVAAVFGLCGALLLWWRSQVVRRRDVVTVEHELHLDGPVEGERQG